MPDERLQARAPTDRERESPGGVFCSGCGAALDAVRCSACGVVRQAGPYRVIRVLHESDHARVYLAEDEQGNAVALKELIFARAPDGAVVDAFEREAALLRQLTHPEIPRFLASFREGEGVHTRLYLAQEHVPGKSLADLLPDHRFEEAEVLRIARQALGILRYLHALSPIVVHRDVKPANLIVRPDDSLALVDFGTAREISPRGTHRATTEGTFGYMPPEALGGTVDRTCDLYGVGAMAVHLLSRRPPEEFLLEGKDLEAHLNASPATIAWLRKLCDPARSRRFQSVDEALGALDGIRPATQHAQLLPPVERSAGLPESTGETSPAYAEWREKTVAAQAPPVVRAPSRWKRALRRVLFHGTWLSLALGFIATVARSGDPSAPFGQSMLLATFVVLAASLTGGAFFGGLWLLYRLIRVLYKALQD